MDCSFCSIFVYKFLRRVLIIDIIKTIALPDTQMWILLNVTCTLSLFNFLTKVLHDSNRATIGGNLNDRYEVSVWPLSWQGRSNSDDNFEIASACDWKNLVVNLLHGLSIGWLGWWLEVLTWAADGRWWFWNGAALHYLLLDGAALHSLQLLRILVFSHFPSFLKHLVDKLLLCVSILLWS